MAHLNRSAKSGNDWNEYDLSAYNIQVRSQSPNQFFGHDLPTDLPNLDPAFIHGTLDTQGLSDETQRLLVHIDFVSSANNAQELPIHDFAKDLLQVVGFEDRGTILRSRYAIQLDTAGGVKTAYTDLCLLLLRSTVLLVVQGDRTRFGRRDPEPPVIAEAIATFQSNNRARVTNNLEELQEMVIPCISMIGTRPTFYKVPVTMALSQSVAAGGYPVQPTIVTKCVVSGERITQGMESLVYREKALKHYMAFRDVARQCWEQFSIGMQNK